jgi:hypothetical protein
MSKFGRQITRRNVIWVYGSTTSSGQLIQLLPERLGTFSIGKEDRRVMLFLSLYYGFIVLQSVKVVKVAISR